jgi:hypothetical protein
MQEVAHTFSLPKCTPASETRQTSCISLLQVCSSHAAPSNHCHLVVVVVVVVPVADSWTCCSWLLMFLTSCDCNDGFIIMRRSHGGSVPMLLLLMQEVVHKSSLQNFVNSRPNLQLGWCHQSTPTSNIHLLTSSSASD